MRHPSARRFTPHELAGAAVFLYSDASAFITGLTVVADGGMTIAL